MKFELDGQLVKIFATKQITERFSKREFVLEVQDGKYPQTIMFEASGRGTEDLDALREGDAVRVSFGIRGREWRNPAGETKYFNSLSAFRIDRVTAGQQASAPPPKPAPAADPDGIPPPGDGDVPF